MSTTTPDPGQRIRQLFAERIRTTRDARGVSRNQLAAGVRTLGLEVTADAVAQWENAVAAPRWPMSVAIAQALGVAWSTIFSLDGEVLT